MNRIRFAVLVLGLTLAIGTSSVKWRALRDELGSLNGSFSAQPGRVRGTPHPAASRPSTELAKAVAPRPRSREQIRVLVTVWGLDYVFRPAKVVVRPGSRVTWANMTASPHTVTSDRPRVFYATVRPYGHVTMTFLRAGKYPYHCSYHPYQRGEVVVRP